MSEQRTIISNDGTWRTMRFVPSSGWVTVDRGRLTFRVAGQLPPAKGAYLPAEGNHAVVADATS